MSAHTMDGCSVVGTPGVHARQLMRTARGKQWASWLAGILLAGVAVLSLGHYGLITVLSGVFAVLCLIMGDGFRREGDRAAVGYRAERDTVRRLQSSKFRGTVFCGLLLGGGGDADLVIVTAANRVIVAEVKAVKGHVSVSGEQILSNRRVLPRQPVSQVRRQVAALSRLGIPSLPVIVASDATMPHQPQSAGGVAVVTSAGLPRWVSSVNAPWSTVAVDILSRRAAQQVASPPSS